MLVADRGERQIGMPREDQFAMNLIRDYGHMIAAAYFAEPYQFVAGPHPAGGVVGIAQQQYGC